MTDPALSPASSPASSPALSKGTLLGGRIAYSQPVDGYRTGIEPVLLAAAVPARPGERVVEAGTGAGAGLLALTARVPGLTGLGLELDPRMAAVARANFAANAQDGLRVAQVDVVGWKADAPFDHAFANPPWHAPDGTPSPVAGRRAAKIGETGLLDGWARALGGALRHRGTLTLILPAACLAHGVAALLAADCAQTELVPLWPKAGRPARLVIVSGVRRGKGPGRLSPGLVLHEAGGGYTAAAEAVLRGGEALAG
jgi:tRNA1(Val) A37 N6-methylase TrmN6